jgi:DNA-binding winged helix-turn-helix (wHTH) protein/tetratricopeptide (TPR) repeat protein
MTADSSVNIVPEFTVGEWSVIPARNALTRTGETVHLEPRVMDLLVYLAERPNEVLSPDQIINDVWPHTFVTDGALLTAVSGLRKALGDNPRRPTYIETIPKRGYRLVATSSARAAVLAVLPIRDESGESDRSFLAEGLTTGVIERLGTIPALRVISRSSSMSFTDTNRSPEQIAKKLRARLILIGSLSRNDSGGQMLSVRLTDTAENRSLLDASWPTSENEVAALEQKVSEAVSSAIRDRLRSSPAVTGREAKPEAVIEYLRGRYHFYRLSADHLETALRHFERAAALDPGYPSAHVGIADVWGAYGYWGLRDAREIRHQVLQHIGKAVEIDPDNPDGLTIRATSYMYLRYDWQAAEEDLRRAITLNPNLCHTRMINTLLLGTLRRPQAIDEANLAVRIDPLNPAVLVGRALIFSSLDENDRALQDIGELLALAPEHPPGLQLRADLYWHSRDTVAIEYEREVWQHDDEMVTALAADSSDELALAAAADVLKQRSTRGYVSPYEISRLLSLSGQIEAALDRIEDAVSSGDFMRVDFLQLSPAFAPVRSHLRYRQLAENIGLPV